MTADNIEVYQAQTDERMVVRRCRGCTAIYEPPRSFCSQCLYSDLDFVEVSGRGGGVVHTRAMGPSGFDIYYGITPASKS